MKLSGEATKREMHDEAFEGKYVQPVQADIVATSAYDVLANTHRDELAAREGQIIRTVQKAPWMQWFGNANKESTREGFFADWF